MLNINHQGTESGLVLNAHRMTVTALELVDATDVVAKDFVSLRRRGVAAKAAVQMTGAFHNVSDVTVLVAYEQWERARQEVLA